MPAMTSSLFSSVALSIVSASAFLAACVSASPAIAGSLTRKMNVDAAPDAVWSRIGGFCTIKDWHPLVGVCITDGKTPPTRTLVTRDGSASFVEREMHRDDAARVYAYNFVSSPLPTVKYLSTFQVLPSGAKGSLIVWHGDFTAQPGKERDVEAALANVYDTGLAALKTRFAGQ